MEFFTCPVCGITQPKSLDAFGLPGVNICNECYKKDNKVDSEDRQELHGKITVEANKIIVPK